MFFGLAAMFDKYFRHVLITDVGEFVVLDPAQNTSLADYLDRKEFEGRMLSCPAPFLWATFR